jgi:hypothetical protein
VLLGGRRHLFVEAERTRDESIVVEAKALPLQPDLVVVAYFLNDPDYDPTHYQLLHRYFRGKVNELVIDMEKQVIALTDELSFAAETPAQRVAG